MTTWINPEDIMLSEISETEKEKYCIISLVLITWISVITYQAHIDNHQAYQIIMLYALNTYTI